MGYYSRQDPIHNNDIINNGHDTTAPAAFKKHLMELLFGIITPRPVPSYSAGNVRAKKSLCVGERERESERKKNGEHYISRSLLPTASHESICQIMRAEREKKDFFKAG